MIFISQGIFAINETYNNLSDDIYAPEWQIDDSWVYSGTIVMDLPQSQLNIASDELNLKVVATTEDTYSLQLFGSITGDGEILDVGIIDQIFGTMNCFIDLGKNEFSLEKIYNFLIEGQIKIVGTPVIADFQISLDNVNTTPIIGLIDFPIHLGKQWSTPTADLEINGEVEIEGESQEIEIFREDAVPPFDFNCTQINVQIMV